MRGAGNSGLQRHLRFGCSHDPLVLRLDQVGFNAFDIRHTFLGETGPVGQCGHCSVRSRIVRIRNFFGGLLFQNGFQLSDDLTVAFCRQDFNVFLFCES